jgi:hypothetical protein
VHLAIGAGSNTSNDETASTALGKTVRNAGLVPLALGGFRFEAETGCGSDVTLGAADCSPLEMGTGWALESKAGQAGGGIAVAGVRVLARRDGSAREE